MKKKCLVSPSVSIEKMTEYSAIFTKKPNQFSFSLVFGSKLFSASLEIVYVI